MFLCVTWSWSLSGCASSSSLSSSWDESPPNPAPSDTDFTIITNIYYSITAEKKYIKQQFWKKMFIRSNIKYQHNYCVYRLLSRCTRLVAWRRRWRRAAASAPSCPWWAGRSSAGTPAAACRSARAARTACWSTDRRPPTRICGSDAGLTILFVMSEKNAMTSDIHHSKPNWWLFPAESQNYSTTILYKHYTNCNNEDKLF